MSQAELTQQINDYIKSTQFLQEAFKSLVQGQGQGQGQDHKLEAANVEKPLDELIKLLTLIKSHTTKIGILFKTPMPEEYYSAGSKELAKFYDNVRLMGSVMAQVASGTYLHSFLDKVLDKFSDLLKAVAELLPELMKIVNTTGDYDNRLLVVGKIWNICESFTELLTSGEYALFEKSLENCKSFLNDNIEDVETWLEDPSSVSEDPFDLGDSGSETESIKSASGESQKILDEKVALGQKMWLPVLKLAKLLVNLLQKAVVLVSKKGCKVPIVEAMNTVEKLVAQINEHADDLTTSLTMGDDILHLTKSCDAIVHILPQLMAQLTVVYNQVNVDETAREKLFKMQNTLVAKHAYLQTQ